MTSPRARVAALVAATCLVVSACSREVPGTRPDGGEHSYDVNADPLVNPPGLFEPYPETDPTRAGADATVYRRVDADPTTLNPIFNVPWQDHYMHILLFLNPIRRGVDLIEKFNPTVVESWEESEDHRVFTVNLRPETRWHDGEPWTAHDIVFSWKTIGDDSVPALFYKRAALRLELVRAIDDHTVEYTHRQVLATRMRDMQFPIIPKHIFDIPEERAKDPTLRSSEYWSDRARRKIVGSGPYRFVEWHSNAQIVVERWEDYPFEPPRFKRQVLKVIPDTNVALLLFKKGELDEMSLTGQQFATQTTDADFAAVGVKSFAPRRMFGSIGWNMDGSNPFFDDVRVRAAMSHAFDYEGHLQKSLYGVYRRSKGFLDEFHWAYNAELEATPFDLDRASVLLDEAGWDISDDDGWRYKTIDGDRVRFDFELMMVPGVPSFKQLGDRYGSDLKRIGVSMRPLFVENAAINEYLRQHDFDAWINVVEVTADPDEWSVFFSTDGYENGYNWGAYSNARVDELFEQARTMLDREERRPLYQEIHRITYEEHANTWVYDYNLLWAFSNRLGGVEFSPSGAILQYPGTAAWWKAEHAAPAPTGG
ncbi:MAG: ABC transporter substrate-binding protein [Acidobacteriota bacterium]|nr:ABC transporter substrate-binding protein [Acidobacteriota bacterium]